MKPSDIAGKQLSFEATLDTWAEGMDYCAVSVPVEITEALGTRGAVLVRASLNESAPFHVSLFPVGDGRHAIRIKAKVRKETRTKTGDRVRMNITVLDPAAVATPDELSVALRAADATAGFEALTPGRRAFLIRRITEAAKPDTRRKRIDEAVEESRPAKSKRTATTSRKA